MFEVTLKNVFCCQERSSLDSQSTQNFLILIVHNFFFKKKDHIQIFVLFLCAITNHNDLEMDLTGNNINIKLE